MTAATLNQIAKAPPQKAMLGKEIAQGVIQEITQQQNAQAHHLVPKKATVQSQETLKTLHQATPVQSEASQVLATVQPQEKIKTPPLEKAPIKQSEEKPKNEGFWGGLKNLLLSVPIIGPALRSGKKAISGMMGKELKVLIIGQEKLQFTAPLESLKPLSTEDFTNGKVKLGSRVLIADKADNGKVKKDENGQQLFRTIEITKLNISDGKTLKEAKDEGISNPILVREIASFGAEENRNLDKDEEVVNPEFFVNKKELRISAPVMLSSSSQDDAVKVDIKGEAIRFLNEQEKASEGLIILKPNEDGSYLLARTGKMSDHKIKNFDNDYAEVIDLMGPGKEEVEYLMKDDLRILRTDSSDLPEEIKNMIFAKQNELNQSKSQNFEKVNQNPNLNSTVAEKQGA